MKLNNARTKFAERLRNYSRVVSAKLELNCQNATKIAGLSAAAGMALTAHHAAEAAIVSSGPVNLNVSAGFYQLPKASFNIDGLANFGISAAWLPYVYYGLRQVGFGTTGATNSTGVPGPMGEQIVRGAAGQVEKIALNAPVGPASPWFAPAIQPGHNDKVLVAGNNYYASFPANNWSNPGGSGATVTGFAGIRFDTAGAADKHYGWVRMQLTSDANSLVTSLTVLDWAYSDVPGLGVRAGVGEVPEPTTAVLGTLGALALGASSVRSLRRKHRKQVA